MDESCALAILKLAISFAKLRDALRGACPEVPRYPQKTRRAGSPAISERVCERASKPKLELQPAHVTEKLA